MSEFYIDALPYPNEAGAIATTNVSRDEAAALCTARGKRLCTELEWERACKGPSNTIYEDGDEFRPATCGLGTAAELSAKRPTGQLAACISGFGVREQHGGAWEWTDQPWGRGGRRDLGVLKGGNAVAGELAGRCANSLARPPAKAYPALVRSMKTAELTAPWLPFARETWTPTGPDAAVNAPFSFVHTWVWRPVANELLIVASGCARDTAGRHCGLLVGRTLAPPDGEVADDAGSSVRVLVHVETGFDAAEVAEAGEARHLRFKGIDSTSGYVRDLTYAYGRIDLGEIRR
jgi:hypothetical protein